MHQSNYTKMILKRFCLDKTTSLSTPMVNRSLDIDKNPFRPCEDSEEILGPRVPYMSVVVNFSILQIFSRSDIAFATNLLARYSSASTRRHRNGIKYILLSCVEVYEKIVEVTRELRA